MRFSVDGHTLGRHLTGNEVYVRNLLTEFAALDRRNRFVAHVSADPAHPAVASLPASIVRRPIAANPLIRLGLQFSDHLRRERPALVHVQYTAPLACPVPVVATVHDVSYLDHPEYLGLLRSRQLRLTVRNTIGRAARIIAPSEFSRQEILRAYGLPEWKVVMIPNGVSAAFRPISRPLARHQIRELYGFDFPFILTVGDLQLRKNQLGLIRAFEELVFDCPNLKHHLVMVGQDTRSSSAIRAAARRSAAASRIHFTGWVSDEDLLRFYNAADVFAFPSFYEGFGLPVLEAMACGTAVACSNQTAVFEVADSCALTFHPSSTAEMVRSLRDLLLDAELRARMGRLGQHRASRFTWESAARRTLNVYYEVTGASAAAPVRQSKRAPVSR